MKISKVQDRAQNKQLRVQSSKNYAILLCTFKVPITPTNADLEESFIRLLCCVSLVQLMVKELHKTGVSLLVEVAVSEVVCLLSQLCVPQTDH